MLLEVNNLSVSYPEFTLHPVSFALDAGEMLTIVGESGSGKTTLARAIACLSEPEAQVSGQVYLNGRELLAMDERARRPLRMKEFALSFQNSAEWLNPHLYKIDSSKLLLLDFGKFDKKDYSYVCQDFDDSFYHALAALKEHLRKYQRLVLLFPEDIKHPRSSCQYFNCFCQDYHIDSAIVENTDRIQVRKGEVYIAIRQIEVVNIIKQSRTTGLKCGEDFGLIAYNDTPAYEVIDQGITVLSINWEELGRKAAEFVLTGQEIRTYLPTEVHLRNSI